LDYTKPLAAGAQAKISVGSFLPFSTASTHDVTLPRSIAALRKGYQITSSARVRSCGGVDGGPAQGLKAWVHRESRDTARASNASRQNDRRDKCGSGWCQRL